MKTNQEIFIDNFRCFKDFNFEMSRINILIGENSSGKSSLLKLLLALKQTIEEPEISNLILNGSLVDLGNYKEAIYYHDEKESISFGFMFGEDLLEYFKYFFLYESPTKNKEISTHITKASKFKTYVNILLNKELNSHKNISTKFSNEFLGEIEIEIHNTKAELQLGETPQCTLNYKRKIDNEIYQFSEIGYDGKGFLSIIHSDDLNSQIKKRKLDSIIFFEIAYLLLNQNLLESFLLNIIYLNPLYTTPRRIYFKKDAQSSYKENNLEKFANQISNDIVSTKDMKEFSKILSDFGIVDNIKLLTSKDFPVSEIKVTIKELTSNIYDVGYGVSLQIPMLFEAFLSEKKYGNLFLIEQPEIHLHPRLQAKFIDVLLSMGNKNSYIIETHSEHIVRMLQVLIKEKKYKIKPEDVKIYYFSRGENTFNVSEHTILQNGHLDKNFPSGFYDNSYNLTKSLLF